MVNKSKILVLVEGEKTDYKLMQHLLSVYGIDSNHEIISYNTNIYTLYNEMFKDDNPDSLDILQVLKMHEKNSEKKKLFDNYYSDILLIFDLDPHDPLFSPSKITRMLDHFRESSDMGKLYINYPMVEAFYHMKSIPDDAYNSYIATLDELKKKLYKTRVATENRNHDYRKFAVNKDECNTVIKQNIEKAHLISGNQHSAEIDTEEALKILSKQLAKLDSEQALSVLCTCVFYIAEYASALIEQ
ncbi:MAG: hypothetical protein Q4G23_04710 [Clostridia bacterium]|nr:hypothetical protein [Clostridia bacterium]